MIASRREHHVSRVSYSWLEMHALFRPHAAQSTNQCALHCLLLSKYISGEITLEAYENKVASIANLTLHWSRATGSEYMDNMVGHLYHEFRFQLARAQNWGFRL